MDETVFHISVWLEICTNSLFASIWKPFCMKDRLVTVIAKENASSKSRAQSHYLWTGSPRFPQLSYNAACFQNTSALSHSLFCKLHQMHNIIFINWLFVLKFAINCYCLLMFNCISLLGAEVDEFLMGTVSR